MRRRDGCFWCSGPAPLDHLKTADGDGASSIQDDEVSALEAAHWIATSQDPNCQLDESDLGALDEGTRWFLSCEPRR